MTRGIFRRLGIPLILTGVLAVGCGQNSATTPQPAQVDQRASETPTGATISAVATTTIIADMTANVGGARVNVRPLLPAGVDPHTYAPTPRDVQAIAESQIIFENGLGLDAWIDELIANAGGSRPRVAVTDGLVTLAGDDHDGDQHPADQHSYGEDPHMWLDVQRAIGYVENIRDGLTQVDPDGASVYESNAASFVEQLRQLDREIEQQVTQIPEDRRKIATNHATLGYFAERYGFEIVGTVFEGVSTEQEPSAQQIAQLVSRIREAGVPAIFTENSVNPRLAQQIANEAGVRLVTDLYTDALGEPGSAGDTYIKVMRHNTQQIVETLK